MLFLFAVSNGFPVRLSQQLYQQGTFAMNLVSRTHTKGETRNAQVAISCLLNATYCAVRVQDREDTRAGGQLREAAASQPDGTRAELKATPLRMITNSPVSRIHHQRFGA